MISGNAVPHGVGGMPAGGGGDGPFAPGSARRCGVAVAAGPASGSRRHLPGDAALLPGPPALARQAATESIVLLRNGLLPNRLLPNSLQPNHEPVLPFRGLTSLAAS